MNLDRLVTRYTSRIVQEVGIPYQAANELATTITREIDHCDSGLLAGIRMSSPLSVKSRLLLFEEYFTWTGCIEPQVRRFQKDPDMPFEIQHNAVHKMLVLIQLYMNFVFAGDGLFEVLAKQGPSGSVMQKSARFIRNNPIRALRNAIAHGNWNLTTSGSIRYWRKGSDPNEPLSKFEATAQDFTFYVTFTQCVAWSSLLAVAKKLGDTEEDTTS